ncbi:hypothetical protein LXL04_023388 [Taraxacum kok-saghyz]
MAAGIEWLLKHRQIGWKNHLWPVLDVCSHLECTYGCLMAVATDRLSNRLERLRIKADHMLLDVSLHSEFTPVIASPFFKTLCKKAMSVCIINPLWRIVHLSAPELIKLLHEEDGCYASLDVYWLKSLPKILYELQTVLDSLSDNRNRGVLDRHVWDEANKDEEVQAMLKKIKSTLADYIPVLNDEAARVSDALEELKTVIDVVLLLCCEFLDSDLEFVVFDDTSRRLLESGFTQTELVSVTGNLPQKHGVDEEESMVGFEDDTIKLLDRLTGFSKKLEVIPIVGMAGLGKTTLAKIVYGHPFVVYFFDIRGWSCVSQEYVKRDILLGILRCIVQLTNKYDSISDDLLGEEIYRLLKGQKYLVVFDDIWDYSHWQDLRKYFPDDRNGSRILLTTRNIDPYSESTSTTVHRMRLRTARESWRILQTMVFKNGKCPWRLYDIGKQISRKCCGLPLAVSITAGLLREVAESLSSYIVNDPNQYMDTLALSYNHLPPHLRQCYLYLGAFPVDCDIPVHKLILLWVAQGFVDQSTSKTLEDVAHSYLMDLLGRSLVMVSKKGADGQIKACHIHELLRSMCLWKANEEGFSPIMYRYGRVASSLSHVAGVSESETNQVNLVLCCPLELGECFHVGRSFDYETYKLVRILDIESISILSFSKDVLKLVNLRYLAIQADDGNPPASISNLVHLQILIILSRRNIFVPKSTWDIECLRHLYIKTGENLIQGVSSDCILENLQTISGVCPSTSFSGILTRTPKLRKLGIHGPLVSPLGVLDFPNIRSLNCLETLKLSNTKMYHSTVKSCSIRMFPEMLTRLTLLNTSLNWNEIGTIGLLPNLEVLKLNVNACIGNIWETSDTGFRNLKLLKLQDLDIGKWEASSGHFPRLQRLVVRRCSRLEEIPSAIGNIFTLELIEVSWCGESTARSATSIHKEQQMLGNDFLKVFTSVHRDLQRKRKKPSYD